MNRPHALAAIGVVLAIALGLRVGAGVHAQSLPERKDDRQITFSRDIAPIIFQSCARCHRPGESGPFSLLTYDDVKKHARQIEAVTRTRFMPPWLPEPQALKFADEWRLSDEQIAIIEKWVKEGAPEGNPADLPPQPKFAGGWQLGEPDLVLKAAKPYQLLASGSDMYWNFIFPVPIDRTRWVKAVEIRPGDKRFVHHANILVDRLQNSRQRETEPGAGFEGMEIKIESEAFDPDSHFLFWKPGTVPYVEPEGMALRLDKGTDLVLNVHLQPSGKPETIQPTIGLYFTDQPATKFPMLLQLQNDASLDIPAGEKELYCERSAYASHRCRPAGHLPACALPGQGSASGCSFARWQNDPIDSHFAVGLELAGRISLRGTCVSATGDNRQDALRLRQLRE